MFNRKSDPVPPDTRAPALRRPDRAGISSFPAMANPAPVAPSESIIGSDLSIEGQTITIRCKGSLKVHGNIQADLHSRQLEVGREAVISGSIAAETVNVHGRVNGAIRGHRVTLHTGAEVEGNIESVSLSIEHGAAFDGSSRCVRDAAEIVPQLDSSSAHYASGQLGAQGTGAGNPQQAAVSYAPAASTPPTSQAQLYDEWQANGAQPPRTYG